MYFVKRLPQFFTTLSLNLRQGTNPLSTRPAMLGGGVLALGICQRHLNLIAGPCRSINNYCKQFFMKYFCNIKSIARAEKKRNESSPKQKRVRGCPQIGRSSWLGCCQRQLKPRVKAAESQQLQTAAKGNGNRSLFNSIFNLRNFVGNCTVS